MAKKKKQQKQKVYHLMILDDSASMRTVRGVTISGLNEQLISLRKSKEDFPDQEQIICLLKFGTSIDHETLWNKTINNFNDFNDDTYDPDQGGTALLDGIGAGIIKLRDQIQDELSKRQANAIITIFTDGGENSSKQFTNEQISSLINEIKASGQWTVAFMGCSNDVFEVAASMGIDRGNTMHYAQGAVGTQAAFRSLSQSRYDRTARYDAALNSDKNTDEINKNLDFFGVPNLDMEEDKDETNS